MSGEHGATVCIGHFRIPDRDALAQLRAALDGADKVLVLVGSAFLPRSPRNPFTWEERREIVLDALPEAERGRVQFAPLRERYDDTERAERDVRETVARHGWTDAARRVRIEEPPEGSPLTELLFSGASPEAVLRALGPRVPDSTLSFLRGWVGGVAHQRICDEWRQLAEEKAAWSVAPYPVVLVTVDAVVRAGERVLLVKRGRQPGKGLWALPGGFLDPREPVLQSALRELAEETRLKLADIHAALRGVRVFDHPWRSQRGRVITHAHHFDLGTRELPKVKGSDDAAAAKWVPIAQLPSMEAQFLDDHFHILDSFLRLGAGVCSKNGE